MGTDPFIPLREWIHLLNFLFLTKKNNFCDLLFAFLHTKPLLKRGFTLKGNNMFSAKF